MLVWVRTVRTCQGLQLTLCFGPTPTLGVGHPGGESWHRNAILKSRMPRVDLIRRIRDGADAVPLGAQGCRQPHDDVIQMARAQI